VELWRCVLNGGEEVVDAELVSDVAAVIF
jgi:hypothetical protein